MKKVDTKDDMSGWGRFRINHIVIIWMLLTFGIIFLLIITSKQYAAADNHQGELTEKILRCHKYADQMQDGSDTLTNAIWRFASTEEVEYAEAFLSELMVVQTRDNAIEKIREENINANEFEQIEKADELSYELKDIELYCMHLIYVAADITDIPEVVAAQSLKEEDLGLSPEEMKKKARDILFGQEYLKAKEKITTSVSRFGSDLTMRLEAELRDATKVTARARVFMSVALYVLLAWAIAFWALFRQCIVHPMRKCLEELKDKDREKPLALMGPYELRQLIEAFNQSIERLRDKNQEIYKIKMQDPVTGGFTTQRFDLEVESYLRENRLFAFVIMDIKRFKVINELYGEKTGNRVLYMVHQVILKSLKSGEFAARSRADIFNVVLLEEEPEKLQWRISKIKEAVKEAFWDEQWNEYRLMMNCGVYMVQKEDSDATSIRGRANIARKKSKKEVGLLSPCVFYSEKEGERLINDQRIENQMEQALAREEFQVFLQPKVRLKDEKVVGAEALVRWKTADGQIIPPNDFIPLFEENGFILQLDHYMFRHVCALIRKWIDNGQEVLPISVNLSREHIKEKGFIRRFKKIQEEYQVPPELIEFEMTEEIVVENLETFKEVVTDCNKAGYRCSMDDFGSGYSSLNVLKEITLDVLKLDREFFNGKDNERSENVIKAVLKMAQELRMQTVAEGVEAREFVDFLKEEGCDMVQGYVFYRPMPVNEFEAKVLSSSTKTV